jgi:hypothetical protein
MKKMLLTICLIVLAVTDAYAFTATGTGAISTTFSKNLVGQKMVSFRLHLSAAGGAAEAFTLTLDSGAGTAYDAVLYQKADMTLITDVVYVFEEPIPFRNYNDKLTFTYTNTNSRTWGLEVVFE